MLRPQLKPCWRILLPKLEPDPAALSVAAVIMCYGSACHILYCEVFMPLPEKAFPVSWDQFHRDCRALAWKIAGKQEEWRAIVAITRGGLVPAAIICRELNIRLIETICIESYHDYKKQGALVVKKGISAELAKNGGKNVLVIDDLADTGKTAAIVRDIIPKACFATLYAKPQGKPLIDIYITEVSQDTWIYFPWDMGFSYQEPITRGGG